MNRAAKEAMLADLQKRFLPEWKRTHRRVESYMWCESKKTKKQMLDRSNRIIHCVHPKFLRLFYKGKITEDEIWELAMKTLENWLGWARLISIDGCFLG